MKLSEVKQREEAVRQAENAMVIQNAAVLNRVDELEEERKLEERKMNFNAEVQKAAASIVERQKQATAKSEEFKQKQKQYTREIPKFGNDDDDED